MSRSTVVSHSRKIPGNTDQFGQSVPKMCPLQRPHVRGTDPPVFSTDRLKRHHPARARKNHATAQQPTGQQLLAAQTPGPLPQRDIPNRGPRGDLPPGRLRIPAAPVLSWSADPALVLLLIQVDLGVTPLDTRDLLRLVQAAGDLLRVLDERGDPLLTLSR